MPRFVFTVTICGQGDTPDAAYEDAATQFAIDPGPMPDEYHELDDEEE